MAITEVSALDGTDKEKAEETKAATSTETSETKVETPAKPSTETTSKINAEDAEKAEKPAAESTNEDDINELVDSDTPITLSNAKKLRNENKNLRADRTQLASQLDSLKDELKEVESLKVQLEEANKKITDFEEEKNQLQRNSLLTEVKNKFGLSDRQAKYLKGNTKEELETSAADVAESFGLKPDLNTLTNSGKPAEKSKISQMSEKEILEKFSR